MTRLIIACSLATVLSSIAVAERVSAPAPAEQVSTPAAQPRAVELHTGFAQPPSDQPIIAVDRTAMWAALLHARDANLAAFHAYRGAGMYPSNTYKKSELNVWRDRDRHLCAAATIIKASGQTALVDRVAKDSNFIRLADVKDGPLMDWMLTSGLTQEELVAIQRPFRAVAPPQRPIELDRRIAETARLKKKYQQIEAMLVKDRDHSLDLAVDRLERHSELAAALLAKR